MVLRLLLVYIAFLFALPTMGQDLPSLYKSFHDESQSDSVRVRAFRYYIWDGFLLSDPDSARVLASELYEFSRSRAYDVGMAEAENLIGISYSIQQQPVKALRHFRRSLEFDRKAENLKGVAATLTNIGVIYLNQGKWNDALRYFGESMSIMQESQLGANPSTLMNMAKIYMQQEQWNKALDAVLQARKVYESDDDHRGLAAADNIEGAILEEQGSSEEAITSYRKALQRYSEMEDDRSKALVWNNIGGLYMSMEAHDSAMHYLQLAYEQYAKVNNETEQPSILSNMGLVLMMDGKRQEAASYCERALEISRSVGSLSAEKEACNCLYQLNKESGNEAGALIYLERLNSIADSLNLKDVSTALGRLEFEQAMLRDSFTQAERDRKVEAEHDAELLRKNRTRNLLIASVLVFLILAFILYNRNKLIRRSKQEVEKERDRSDQLLLNILPEEVADELKLKGRADARRFDSVSILFTDLVSFTSTAEKMTPEELVDEIHACFVAFDEICARYGVEKIKTIGDAYMAATGLPTSYSDDALRMVRAALDINDFMLERMRSREEQGLPAFEMRSGIHTGEVVAGIVGSSKFQYDIWGDAVNTASRMESSGEPGKVNISSETYERVKDAHLEFEPRGSVDVKGKGAMSMYFVRQGR